jgi:hypothetical protein
MKVVTKVVTQEKQREKGADTQSGWPIETGLSPQTEVELKIAHARRGSPPGRLPADWAADLKPPFSQ